MTRPYSRGKIAPNEWFIAKSKAKFGDKFDYSKTQYQGHEKPVTIICPIHGEFSIKARQHLFSKHGCTKCSGKMRKTTAEFIDESKAKWGDRADYSKTEYVNAFTPVIVTCKVHGDFETIPHNHKSRFGCPKCAIETISATFRKPICGVAVNDGEISEIHTRVYQIWHSMIKRTCDDKTKTKHKGYEKTRVCTEWLSFNAFKSWVESPDSGYKEDYELDKDILGGGLDIYSPETCCFVHPRINKLLIHRKGRGSKLPLGVSRCGNKFSAYCSHGHKIINLGTFATPEDAFEAYKSDKEAYIKQVAQEYFDNGNMHKRIYDALMKYEVKPSM